MGLPLVALGQLAFSFYNVVLELLAPARIQTTIPTLQIVAVRFLITYVGCVTTMRARRIPHAFLGPPAVRGLLLLRGITGFLGIGFAVYHSLGYLTSDSTTLSFLTPVMSGFMGHLFLNEPFTPRELASAFASLLGVVCITKPHAVFGGRDEDTLVSEAGETLGAGWGVGESKFAVGLGLLGVLSAAAAYTIIAAIGRRSHPLHVVAAFSGSSVVASVLGMVVFQIRPVLPPTVHAAGLLLFSGVLGLCGQVLITMGLQGEKAGRGSLVLYLQIIFSGLVDRLVLPHVGQRVSVLSLFGSLIILLSAWFGTFAKTLPAPVALFSPLPMPASSPKVSRSPSYLRPASAASRDRRSSLANKQRPSPPVGPSALLPPLASKLLGPALKAWGRATETLQKTSHPLSQPLATDRAVSRRPRINTSPPPSPASSTAALGPSAPHGLQLEIDGGVDGGGSPSPSSFSRPWRSSAAAASTAGPGAAAANASGSSSGRQSVRPQLDRLDIPPSTTTTADPPSSAHVVVL